MSDKLFFGEIEREAKAAIAAYMKARGPHGSPKKSKTIDVKGNPGSGYGVGEKKKEEGGY